MKHIVVDLEMNSLARQYKQERTICGMEIIEIGAVVLDEQYQEIGSFKTLVKPQFNDIIKPYYEKLTGISTAMVANAPIFEDALKMFCSWCNSISDDIQIYQWSETDVNQVNAEINLKNIIVNEKNQEYLNDWLDIQKEFGEKLNLLSSISLKSAVMYAGSEFEGSEHNALDDARNTATILRTLRVDELCEKKLSHIIEVLTPTPVSTTLGSVFDFSQLRFGT